MKRFTVLLIIMLVTSFIIGCFDGGSDDKDNDKVTTGTIKVKATYTNSVTDTNTGGTEKIFLWLQITQCLFGCWCNRIIGLNKGKCT